LYVLDTGNKKIDIFNINKIYENAEDGQIERWEIYDNNPIGAQINCVYDDGLESNVIQFDGAGQNNGYLLRNQDGSKWKNTNHTVIEWKMKWAGKFTIFVEIATDDGLKYLSYTSDSIARLGTGRYIHHGLGHIVDGQWHTIVRDLSLDLQEGQPNVHIESINGFLVRGSGSIDDIELMHDIPTSLDSDGDGITDLDEMLLYKTKAAVPDTDRDGINDGEELDYWGADDWAADYDDDGLSNIIDNDSDNDSFTDGEEINSGTNPIDPTDYPEGNSETIYENGEDGLTSRWKIYDDTPTGAEVQNVYDEDKQSNVMRFVGTGRQNGYMLLNATGDKWNNDDQFIIEWKMKFEKSFEIFIEVETDNGRRYLSYTPESVNRLSNEDYIHHGLGSVADGSWHTINRDIRVDLQEGQPSENLIKVNSFLVRGNGAVDDVKLLSN
jgi:hypothetical protein